jgi:hypothetical protein
MTVYTIRERKEPFDPCTLKELANAKFATELGGDDNAPRHLIHGEWYCENADCAVREVRIHAKWPDGDRPAMPRFVCPQCSLNLKFHGHLTTITLVPGNQ